VISYDELATSCIIN